MIVNNFDEWYDFRLENNMIDEHEALRVLGRRELFEDIVEKYKPTGIITTPVELINEIPYEAKTFALKEWDDLLNLRDKVWYLLDVEEMRVMNSSDPKRKIRVIIGE